MPTGTLMKKIHDQLSGGLAAPPSSTPAAAAAAGDRAPDAERDVALAALREHGVRIESAAGASSAPPSPCRARKAISEPSDQASRRAASGGEERYARR